MFDPINTWHRGHRAGRDRLRRLLDFDKAHPAVPSDRQPLVVAEPGDVDAGDRAGLQHGHPLRDLDGVTIDEDLDGVIGVGEVDPGSGDGGPRGVDLGLGLHGGGGGGFGFVEVRGRGDTAGG